MEDSATRILVTFDSRMGSTAEIAAFIGDVLSKDGNTVDVLDHADVEGLDKYDRVIIGSAIRYDRWLPGAIEFVRKNAQTLQGKSVACFFVCLTLAHRTPETERKAATYADKIRAVSPAVQPASVEGFGGVLSFARAPLLAGLALRLISLVTGVKQGDYRDWDAIGQWALNAFSSPS